MSAFDPIAAVPVAAARGLRVIEVKAPKHIRKNIHKKLRQSVRSSNLIKS